MLLIVHQQFNRVRRNAFLTCIKLALSFVWPFASRNFYSTSVSIFFHKIVSNASGMVKQLQPYSAVSDYDDSFRIIFSGQWYWQLRSFVLKTHNKQNSANNTDSSWPSKANSTPALTMATI